MGSSWGFERNPLEFHSTWARKGDGPKNEVFDSS